MNASKMTPSANAVGNSDATAMTPSTRRSELLRREQMQRKVRHPTSASGMSDTLRTVVWVTGVAFGVFAPGAFARSEDAGDSQANPVFQKLDADHDSFVSRDEAKQNSAVDAGFGQTDTTKQDKLDEDEIVKALSISQRELVARIAVDGVYAAKQSARSSRKRRPRRAGSAR